MEEVRETYPSDLTDKQWGEIEPLYEGMRNCIWSKRELTIVVDMLGCLLSVVVHAANIHDTKGGIFVAKRAHERYPSIHKFCADAGYRGTFISDLEEQESSMINWST